MPPRHPALCHPSLYALALAAVLAVASSGCGDDPPPWCAGKSAAKIRCSGPHCVLGLVIDYKRLEPRGYRVLALDGKAINRAEAETIARDHVVNDLEGEEPKSTECERAEDFYHCGLTYGHSDRWLVVLHGVTGKVLFAGFELWADSQKRGYDFPLPEGFSDEKTIGCAGPLADPERKQFVITGSTGMGEVTPPSTPRQALDVARQTDVAVRFVGGARYRALVITYGPAIGELDIESADWLVWLYRMP